MFLSQMFQNYLEEVKITKSRGYYDFNKCNINIINNYFTKVGVKKTSQINLNKIKLFIKYLKECNNCNNSLKKKLDCLKRALKYNSIQIKGLEQFKIGNVVIKRFQVFNQNQLSKILTYYKNLDKSDSHNLTKYLVVLMLLLTGCRRNELINIKIKNIDLENNMIILEKTKTGKPRIVFIQEFIKSDIESYIKLKEREYLFYNFRYNHRFTCENLTAMIRYDKSQLKLTNYSSHMFRHTFATMMVENGCSIPGLQILLGHSSSKTTDIYLHMSTKFVKNNYDKYFPTIE